MAAISFSNTSFIRRMQVCRGSKKAVPHSSEFLGRSLKKSDSSNGSPTPKIFKIVAEVDEKKQTSKDRWKGLAFDTLDDQQDITRGKGAVDPLFQAPMGSGTHDADTPWTI